MNSVMESTSTVCVVLVAVEIVSQLCPKNGMVRFVKGFVSLVLLASVATSLLSLDWDLESPKNKSDAIQEELSGYVQEQCGQAAEREIKRSIEGLLAVAGLEAEQIEIFTDIDGDSRIVLTKISAVFLYESDAQRARALLENTLGEEIDIEVKINGS